MKKYFSISFISIFIALISINGCTDFLTQNSPSGDTGSSGSGSNGTAGTIEILNPTSNDTIGYSGEYIQYKVNGGTGIQHIEFYVNGKLSSLLFPSAEETTPKIKFEVDKSLVGTRFEYYLFYFDKNGSSSVSATQKNILISDIRIAPYPPYDVKLTPLIGGGAINIAWKDSSSFDVVYHVVRSVVMPFVISYISPELKPKTFNFTDTTGIVSGKTYYYKVIATRFGSTNSSESEIVSTTGGSTSNFLLEPPSNLVVTRLSDSSAKLDWQNNGSGYTYIVVERRMNAAYIPDRIASLIPTSTTYIDNTILQWQGYSYRIKVFSQTDSAWSEDVQLK